MKNSIKLNSLKKTFLQNLKLTSNTAFYKGIIVVLMTTLFMFLTSCKKDYGEVMTRELNVAQFSSISNSGEANISVEYGSTQKVEVTGNEVILDKILANVSGYNLDLDLKNGIYSNYQLSYIITVPYIEKVKIKGSGNINIGAFDQTENLTLDINGSGGITFNAFPNIERIDVDISGSGSVIAQHTIDSLQKLNIDISGSGMYSGFMVKTKKCDVDIAGSGNADVYVIDDLDVDISGSGNVNYKGFPVIDTDISGSGNVSNKN